MAIAGRQQQDLHGGVANVSAAIGYIRGRQTPAGGFSFYRSWGVEEPAAADTWYAVAALALLGAAPEHDKACIRWLLDCQDANGGYAGIGTAWHVVEALALLAARPRSSPAEWLAPWSARLFDGADEADDAHGFLLNLLRYIELRKRFELGLESRHRSAIEAHLKRLRDGSGAFSCGAANLVDSAVALQLTRAAGLIADRRLLAFALACEDSVCGFRAVPAGRSTSLEVLAAGVAILDAFNIAPGHPQALLNMIAACQHASGGFGRHSGAVATLRDTWLAVFVADRIEVHCP